MKIVSRGEVAERLQCMSDWGLSHIPYYANFRFNNAQICRQFLHAFFVNSGVLPKKFFGRSILCYVSEGCVKGFNGSKRIKGRF